MSISKRDVSSFAHLEQVYRTARTAIRALAAVAVAYIFRDSVTFFAGQTTKVGLELSAVGDIKFVATISVAGLASAWAYTERKLRHRKVETLQGRIGELERRLDPNRSTSGLTTAGKTHPRDKD